METIKERTTLRHFLEIVGKSFFVPYICGVYIEKYEDEYWGTQTNRIKFNGSEFIRNIDDLNPYLDYEIYGFDQIYRWGELEEQVIWLREMN